MRNSINALALIVGAATAMTGAVATDAMAMNALDSPIRLAPSSNYVRTVSDRQYVFSSRDGAISITRDDGGSPATTVVGGPSDDCDAPDVTPGFVLLVCDAGSATESWLRVYDVAGQRSINLTSAVQRNIDNFDGMGRYWLAGQHCETGPPRCVPAFLNWRTREFRVIDEAYGRRDLDRASLPIRVQRAAPSETRGGVTLRRVTKGRSRGLFLERGRRVLRLTRCRSTCLLYRLAPNGAALWLERGSLHYRRGFTSPTSIRKVPGLDLSQFFRLSLTRRFIYISGAAQPSTGFFRTLAYRIRG